MFVLGEVCFSCISLSYLFFLPLIFCESVPPPFSYEYFVNICVNKHLISSSSLFFFYNPCCIRNFLVHEIRSYSPDIAVPKDLFRNSKFKVRYKAYSRPSARYDLLINVPLPLLAASQGGRSLQVVTHLRHSLNHFTNNRNNS